MKIFNILHIAPFNVAGVPITFVNAERELGHYSRLITCGRNPRGYQEDICLDLPFINFKGLNFIKRLLGNQKTITNVASQPDTIPLYWRPGSTVEKLLIRLREMLWKPFIDKAVRIFDTIDFDIIQLDGGMEFYRDARLMCDLKRCGKKIICCYTGSDLRVRGVLPHIDAISDLNITVEFDHLKLHPDIHHVFFPFDSGKFQLKKIETHHPIKIGHAPTNRQAKGSDIIIAMLHELQQEYPVEIVLIENLPYAEALNVKSGCDIFIDQIGDLGYGINSLESLAMGIPTCSCLAPGFEEKYPDHPFIVINAQNLKNKLIALIENDELRLSKMKHSRDWVVNYHDSQKVVSQIHELIGIDN